jgi:hypothetical protein
MERICSVDGGIMATQNNPQMTQISQTKTMPSIANHQTLFWTGIALCLVLRLIALSSDAYPRLSWSSGLLTDEGYYLHNARNAVLWGEPRQDDWNNALIMPTLHALQVGVFRVCGVGIVQARCISVLFSVILLIALRFALAKSVGKMPAIVAALALGLDHANLLYNRMALLDTPAACCLVLALWCFVQGVRDEKQAAWWGVGCGLMMTLAYTVRGLSALLFVVPIIAAWSKEHRPFLRGYVMGIGGGMACYILAWYLPNRAEISRYNAYYLNSQLMPRSFHQLGNNIQLALFSWQRGMIPYLIKHTPIIFCLAMWQTVAFFRLWLLLLLMTFAGINYAPSRYYVLFYPPLFALAALTFTNKEAEGAKEKQRVGERRPAQYSLLTAHCILWLFVNGYWLTDWARQISYRQIEADRRLARMLPEGSWIIGSVANGLCINNRLRPVNVISGLCNGDKPIERRRGEPRYILILDGKWRQRWWDVHYGAILTPEHRIYLFKGLLRDFFQIGLYRVPD